MRIMAPKACRLGMMLLISAAALQAAQGAKAPVRKDPVPLTEEEKEILKDREILENLELLQNLDKCRLLDLFLEDQDGEKAPAPPAAKKDEQKKK